MAIVSKEDLKKQLNELLGDNTSDEALALIENLEDTFNDLSKGDNGDAKKRIAELEEQVKETDKMWRDKYRERFFSGVDNPLPTEDPSVEKVEEGDGEEDAPETFDDLFSKE